MLEPLVRHLRDLLGHAIGLGLESVLVLHDARSSLSRLLTDGYRRAVPQGDFLDVDAVPAEALRARVELLLPGDLVVLVESTRFELQPHRFRLALFQRGLKVVEHPHLGRMQEAELGVYVDSLAYDPDQLRPLGRALKACLDGADRIRLHGGSEELVYAGPFEDAKLNVGDYAASKQVGGQFPIGEVFTEAVDLERCQGSVPIYAYGESDFSLRRLETPFPLVIRSGRVVDAPGAPGGFLDVLAAIRAAEGEVWVRELGFGLNRAFSKQRTVTDVGSYERVCGVHLSLGARHAVYPKAGFNRKETKYHVDVFCDLDRAEVGDRVVWEDGRYLLP